MKAHAVPCPEVRATTREPPHSPDDHEDRPTETSGEPIAPVPTETWTSAECAAAWGVKTATWLGYVSRGQAPEPLPDDDERGRRRWDAAAVRAFPRPGSGRARAGAAPEAVALLAEMTAVAAELAALRDRQRDLAVAGKAQGVEVRAMARALGVSPQTVYGWLDAPDRT